jgi:hypothetical protein
MPPLTRRTFLFSLDGSNRFLPVFSLAELFLAPSLPATLLIALDVAGPLSAGALRLPLVASSRQPRLLLQVRVSASLLPIAVLFGIYEMAFSRTSLELLTPSQHPHLSSEDTILTLGTLQSYGCRPSHCWCGCGIYIRHYHSLHVRNRTKEGPWSFGRRLPVLYYYRYPSGQLRGLRYSKPLGYWFIPHSYCCPISLGYHSRNWSVVPPRISSLLCQERQNRRCSKGTFQRPWTTSPVRVHPRRIGRNHRQ